MDTLSLMIMLACVLVPSVKVSIAVDSIGVSQSISDGSETLVSQGGRFELGFFSPGNSKKRYLGIWYKNIPIQTVVWVANRANPINDSSGILTVNSAGNLVLTQNGSVVWHTSSQKQAQNPVVELLESGNLVVRNKGEANQEEAYLWQSFDYPCDTLLPGMKLGWDLRNNVEHRLTAWKSPDDPSPGDFSRRLLLHNYPELFIMKGTQKFSRTGPWNGLYLNAAPFARFNSISHVLSVTKNNFMYVSNKDELFYTFAATNNSSILRNMLNQTLCRYHYYVWLEDEKRWRPYLSYPIDPCDKYGVCGPNGNCRISESPVCQCLKGFSPKAPLAWNSSNWTQGCVRNVPLSCHNKRSHGFVKLAGVKVPDARHTWLDENIDTEECRVKCLNKCSCTAFSNSDIRGAGSGCVMWFGDLIDIRDFKEGGQHLYIRVAASELGKNFINSAQYYFHRACQ